MTKRKRSKMDRVHVDIYALADEIKRKQEISRVQAYKEIARMAKQKKGKDAKELFKI